MRFLHNTPIKRKLTIIMMLTTGAALLFSSTAILTYEVIDDRDTQLALLLTTAEMIGYNNSAALSFNDPDSAESTLKSLAADPSILSAAIYNKGGKLFAVYQNARAPGALPFPAVEHDTHHFRMNTTEVFRDIKLDGETIGTVYLCRSLEGFWLDLERYIGIVTLVAAVASATAYFLSRSLLGIITRPISHLAEVASKVATEKDYAVRASRHCNDELGELIGTFNGMLEQIQHRELALQAARDELERRVDERTVELANSISLLNATLDSTADGILAVPFTGEIVCYNTKFVAMWNVPDALLKSRNSADIRTHLASQTKHPEKFLQRTMQMMADQTDKDTFDMIELNDGRIFERYVKPQHIGGKNVGVVVTYRDITQRKQYDAKMESITKQLVEISRQAGMAEVATSVLHNVGNVLNSVNVSCSVVSDRIRKSRVSSVAKTADLLRQHDGDLAAFFTNDPAGRKLPEFIAKLAARLTEEQVEVLQELQSLGQNIEHIKDIVAVQQNYAKNIGGVRETLPIAPLVEDVLRMNEQGLARHNVEIIREYAEVPPVSMEKHKVLQILVNLVRNAKHALTEQPHPARRLIVRISSNGERVSISLTDNGVGIAPENLTRIFAHGFTTKKDGHGFGLHSGVLAAQDMGGRLFAHSDGPGLGATFTLELPLKKANS